MPLEDYELLAEWSRSHYERALRTIVERRLPQVMGAASRLTDHPDTAVDLAGKVFMKLAGQPPRLVASEPLSGWLHTQTRTLALEAAPRSAPPAVSPAARGLPADWSMVAPHLDEAIDALAIVERDMLALRFFEGNAVAAISERVGLDEAMVKTRITKALDKLHDWFDERGITVSPASLATMLAGQASEPVTPELVAAIANNAIAAPRLAPPPPTGGGAVWAKRLALAVAGLLLLASAVWLQSYFQNKDQDRSVGTPTPADETSRRVTGTSAGRTSAGGGTLVARALELAEAGKAAALTDWVARFATGKEIEEFLILLRADPQGTAELLGVLGRYLTARWAEVDAASCVNAFLKDGALHQRDPFDSGVHPLLADPAATAERPGFWSIIGKAGADGLDNWLQAAPADLVAALLGDRGSATYRAWAASDAAAAAATAAAQRETRNAPVQGAGFLAGDFATLLLSRSPGLLLRPGFSSPEAAARSGYNEAFVGRFAEDDGFCAALLTRFKIDDLWQSLAEMLAEAGDAGPAAVSRLATAELASARQDVQQTTARAVALPAGVRQAATLSALLDSLDPRADRNIYWAGLSLVAKAVHETEAGATAATDPLAAELYFNLRSRVATGIAAVDLASALEWAAPIRDDGERLSCLIQIAAREVAPQARAWAARDADGSGYKLYFEQPDSDQTISFQVLAVPGETLGAYYVRLRDTLREHAGARR